MITDLVVWMSIVLAAVFCAAWALSPAFRVRIERPKYTFLDAVRRYDRDARGVRADAAPGPQVNG